MYSHARISKLNSSYQSFRCIYIGLKIISGVKWAKLPQFVISMNSRDEP